MNIYHGGTETRRNNGLLSEALTESVIRAAIEEHRYLGPGLLESVYQECLCQELRLREIPFVAQVELPINYKGVEVTGKYRIDLMVADDVVVELKSVERLLNVYEAQRTTYLKLTGKTCWPDHQFQRSRVAPRKCPPSSMTEQHLRDSVFPWWEFSMRRSNE
jgi:GxxExxY protein